MSNQEVNTIAFYSDRQLDAVTSLSRATRWRMRREGTFPNPVHISKGRVGYPKTTIDDWIASRIEGVAA